MVKTDWDQVKVIIRYTLKMELREKAARNPGRRSYRMLISLGIVYLFSGFFLGLLNSRITDPFTTAFIVATFFMVLAASFILLEYPTLVTGPEDFFFYAAKPVSSRTYFTAKVLTTLCLILLLLMIYIVPYAVISLLCGKTVLLVAGSIAAACLSGLYVTLLIINLYGLLVKYIPYRVIRSVASLLQFFTFLSVYLINILISGLLRRGDLNPHFELRSWLLLIPGSWSAALFRLADNPLAAGAFALAVVSLPLLFLLSTRVISLDYAGKISEFALRSETRKSRVGKASFLWRTPEAYAVSRLIINHLKYNAQFRMGMIAILPITVIYFVIALVVNNALILDPFTAAGRDNFPGTIILYMAIGFFPVYIKNALTYSTEARAGWVFFTAPVSRMRLVAACRRFILLFFVVPYLAAFTVVFFIFTGALLHTLMHFLVITLLALIIMNIFMYFFAEMPFSKVPQKGQRTAQMFLRILLAFSMPAPLTLFVYLLYPLAWTYWLGVAVLAGCLVVTEVFGRSRAAARLDREEYSQ